MAKYKFKVLSGSHRIGPVVDPATRKIIKPGYNAQRGDIVESSVDLNSKFPSDPQKFLLVDSPEQVEEDFEASLKKMSKGALIKKAEEEEIDISGCNSKEDIIAAFLEQVEM